MMSERVGDVRGLAAERIRAVLSLKMGGPPGDIVGARRLHRPCLALRCWKDMKVQVATFSVHPPTVSLDLGIPTIAVTRAYVCGLFDASTPRGRESWLADLPYVNVLTGRWSASAHAAFWLRSCQTDGALSDRVKSTASGRLVRINSPRQCSATLVHDRMPLQYQQLMAGSRRWACQARQIMLHEFGNGKPDKLMWMSEFDLQAAVPAVSYNSRSKARPRYAPVTAKYRTNLSLV